MAYGYLILAAVLAFTLNHVNGFVRASGSLIAAVSLAFIVISIALADFDGTFAAFLSRALGLDSHKPLVLNLQGAAALLAIPFLLWTAFAQWRRGRVNRPDMRNSTTSFGLVSRYFHWTMAVLILCLIPIGLFVAVLPEGSTDRAMFLGAHQSLGLTVLALTILRLVWFAVTPAPAHSPSLSPAERSLALGVRAALYLLIVGFPVSGYLINAFQGDDVDLYGSTIPALVGTSASRARFIANVHDIALPLAFYAAVFAHVGAAVKHHFFDRRRQDIRRMIA